MKGKNFEKKYNMVDKPEPSLGFKEVFKSAKTGQKYDTYGAMVAAEAEYDRLEKERMKRKTKNIKSKLEEMQEFKNKEKFIKE